MKAAITYPISTMLATSAAIPPETIALPPKYHVRLLSNTQQQKARCGLTGKVLNDEESRQRGQDHGAGEEHQFLNDRAGNGLEQTKYQ